MRLDRGLHIRCGLVRFTGFRPGIQAVHGDFGLLGQIQRFGQRIGGLARHDVVGGQHDGCRTLTVGIRMIGFAISETGEHRRARHHAVANQGGGVLAVLRAFEPIGDVLIFGIGHLIDVILLLDAFKRLVGGGQLFGDQFVVVGQREHRA